MAHAPPMEILSRRMPDPRSLMHQRFVPPPEILACPVCVDASLVTAQDGWRCERCATTYPSIGGIPWLVPYPVAALGEWRLRLARLIGRLDADAAQIEGELADMVLPSTTRTRIKLMAGARRDHARRLTALLAPMTPERVRIPEAMHAGFGTPLPLGQDLTSYYVNVHRDWVWGDEENRLALELVTRVRGNHPPGRVLVLGAGAGRLAYDMHDAWSPDLTVAADINPLLLLLASRLFDGGTVELYEFPIAPRSSDCCALLRRLSAPAPARAGLTPVFADAGAPPFVDSAFDTVVTPWLIDILDASLDAFLAQLNRVLRPGGVWINTGSLVFARPAAAQQLSVEELLDRITACGFERPEIVETEVPYMRSPASRHARMETVVTFASRSIEATAQRQSTPYGPAWLHDERRPVPRDASIEFAMVSSRIHAFVLSLIDGHRSISDMAGLLVEQRLMTAEDALPAIRSFLARLHEERSRPRWQ